MRRIVVVVAVFAVVVGVLREQQMDPQRCVAALKTLCGAVEMYNLDK